MPYSSSFILNQKGKCALDLLSNWEFEQLNSDHLSPFTSCFLCKMCHKNQSPTQTTIEWSCQFEWWTERRACPCLIWGAEVGPWCVGCVCVCVCVCMCVCVVWIHSILWSASVNVVPSTEMGKTRKDLCVLALGGFRRWDQKWWVWGVLRHPEGEIWRQLHMTQGLCRDQSGGQNWGVIIIQPIHFTQLQRIRISWWGVGHIHRVAWPPTT